MSKQPEARTDRRREGRRKGEGGGRRGRGGRGKGWEGGNKPKETEREEGGGEEGEREITFCNTSNKAIASMSIKDR